MYCKYYGVLGVNMKRVGNPRGARLESSRCTPIDGRSRFPKEAFISKRNLSGSSKFNQPNQTAAPVCNAWPDNTTALVEPFNAH